MVRTFFAILAALTLSNYALAADEVKQPLVTIDEDMWVTFYDVPSRRFHDIRTKFVQRDFDAAAANLVTSGNYLKVETSRAIPELAERLNDVSGKMHRAADNILDDAVTVTGLDALFGRAHWLLAQHYIDMAKRSRDNQQFRNEGLYLWATIHHLERAVLWSNARIDRNLYKTLEELRELAGKLQDPALAAQANRGKPVVRAEKTLRETGKQIDRPVVLPRVD